ncbi:MAG: mercury resistance system periplasmic binding protein MerP [Ottowia sp.]
MFKHSISNRVRFTHLAAAILFAAGATQAWSATREVRLAVPGMTCAACPITVKKALSKVKGVQKVDVDYAQRQATVTFDDAQTNVRALTDATRDAGYPSMEKSQP